MKIFPNQEEPGRIRNNERQIFGQEICLLISQRCEVVPQLWQSIDRAHLDYIKVVIVFEKSY